jgi:hypothetical protein
MVYLCSHDSNVGMQHFFYKNGIYYLIYIQPSLSVFDKTTTYYGRYVSSRKRFVSCQVYDYEIPSVLEYVDFHQKKPDERFSVLNNILEQKIFDKI